MDDLEYYRSYMLDLSTMRAISIAVAPLVWPYSEASEDIEYFRGYLGRV
jgi:hypothetical protein